MTLNQLPPRKYSWKKPILTLVMMGLLVWCIPSGTVDSWNLFNPKKIATMVFALIFIQIFGTGVTLLLGARAGSILTGFFGGLVSSTATTASLARKSKLQDDSDSSSEMLVFLSATAAMLIEALILVYSGTSNLNPATLIVFVGPLVATGIMVALYSRKVSTKDFQEEEHEFRVLPILKLALFIVTILLLSKLLQNFFGQNGLMVLTFLVSLFEIHGSVIANVQLYESGAVATRILSILLGLSIVASYLSKIFLISTLGHRRLRMQALKCTLFLFLSLLVSELVALGFSGLS